MSKNGRAYTEVRDLATIKERNATVRELEAQGFTCDPGGSKKYGYKVTGWKGDKPDVIRSSFGIGTGTHEVTPLYRRADGHGWEYMDGTPEHG